MHWQTKQRLDKQRYTSPSRAKQHLLQRCAGRKHAQVLPAGSNGQDAAMQPLSLSATLQAYVCSLLSSPPA